MSTEFLSDDDKALFRRTVQKIRRGPKDKDPTHNQQSNKTRSPEPPSTQTDSALISSIYLSDYYAEEINANSILCHCCANFPQKRFKQLQMGQIPWQAKLDLHGQNREEAKRNLILFITQHTVQTHRCLLIIHGKGNHHNDEAPILKNLINRWLPQFPSVLAFHSALPKDGGSGALYVLLKRQR